MLKSLELFSGMGGLAKGLNLSGFEHEKFVEFNKHACSSLRANFGDKLVFEGDIRSFDFQILNSIDVVAGGPPCQPFSMGGKHKANGDGRDMFPLAIAAITALQPKAFIFENVKGLLRSSFSDYFDYILLRLSFPDRGKKPNQDWQDHLSELRKARPSGLHYDVNFKLLNAANFGVPQTRERVFIVGVRSDLNVRWRFPVETHSKQALMYEQKANGIYWERHAVKPEKAHVSCFKSEVEQEQRSLFSEPLKPWVTVRDAISHLPDPLCNHGIDDHIFKGGAKAYPGHTGSYYDLPAKTLKAGVHGVPGGENMVRYADDSIRYFTVHEAKLLQTFPAEFVVTGAWGEAMRQIGNAVPVSLARIIGTRLRETLEGDNRNERNGFVGNVRANFQQPSQTIAPRTPNVAPVQTSLVGQLEEQ